MNFHSSSGFSRCDYSESSDLEMIKPSFSVSSLLISTSLGNYNGSSNWNQREAKEFGVSMIINTSSISSEHLS